MRSYKGFVPFAFLTWDELSPSLNLNVGCGIESMWHKSLNCSLGEYLPANDRPVWGVLGQSSKLTPTKDGNRPYAGNSRSGAGPHTAGRSELVVDA